MKKIAIASSLLMLASAGFLTAQDPPKPAAPEKEHRWLQQLVGEWSYESEATVAPGQPPLKCTGTERTRDIGGLWMVAESSGEVPMGGRMTAIMTLGYDPEKKKYVGTWICNMMSQLWTYEGTLDATGKILTLETEGPDFTTPGKKARYRDVIEMKDADHKVLTSLVLADDGKWHSFVTANYRRTKK